MNAQKMTAATRWRVHRVAAAGAALLLAAAAIAAVQAPGGPNAFLPHGYCMTWIPSLLWLHVASDALIALAYLSIPVTLLVFLRRRGDLPFGWIVLLFCSFIVACGATHALEVWTLWNPDYWLSGGVKALTAGVSLTTAVALVGIMPRALALPSVAQLRAATAALEAEVEARRRVEAELRRAHDELERRVLERTAEVARANALLDAVFDAAPVGLALFDEQDRYVRVNPALARINGTPVQAHLGRRLDDIVPALARTVSEQFAQVRASGAPLVGVEVAGPTPGRPQPTVFRVSYFPVPGDGGPPLMGAVCEDIGDLRAAERERTAALAAAQRANRLKDEFVARVSHELRTPLQALMSWVALLRSRRADAATAERAVDRIDHNVRLQARMITDLLELSSAMSGKLSVDLEPCRPDGVIRHSIETLAAAARDKGVTVVDAVAADDAVLETDAQRLEQVANNLVANAIKYTPAGGSATVATAWSADGWTLTVRDDGVGIAPEDLEQVFEPFHRGAGTGSKHGLGLGLAIARGIVERLGGRIAARSEGPGRGAEFEVWLPR